MVPGISTNELPHSSSHIKVGHSFVRLLQSTLCLSYAASAKLASVNASSCTALTVWCSRRRTRGCSRAWIYGRSKTVD